MISCDRVRIVYDVLMFTYARKVRGSRFKPDGPCPLTHLEFRFLRVSYRYSRPTPTRSSGLLPASTELHRIKLHRGWQRLSLPPPRSTTPYYPPGKSLLRSISGEWHVLEWRLATFLSSLFFGVDPSNVESRGVLRLTGRAH